MSVYAVNLFLHSIAGDDLLRGLVTEDAEAALDVFDLEDDERQLLLAGEVGELYDRGVDGFLLHNLERLTPLVPDLETYSERMRRSRKPKDQTTEESSHDDP